MNVHESPHAPKPPPAKPADATQLPPGLKEHPPEHASHMKWVFHGKEGTKEELCAIVQASKFADEVKTFLCWCINSREGRAFRLNTSAAAEHPGELHGNIGISKIF